MNITSSNVVEYFDPTYWERHGVHLHLILKEFDLYPYELLYAHIPPQSTEEGMSKLCLEFNMPKNIYNFSGDLPKHILLEGYEEELINKLRDVLNSIQNPTSESGQPLDFNSYIQNCELGYQSINSRFCASGLFDPFQDKGPEDIEPFFKKNHSIIKRGI